MSFLDLLDPGKASGKEAVDCGGTFWILCGKMLEHSEEDSRDSICKVKVLSLRKHSFAPLQESSRDFTV